MMGGLSLLVLAGLVADDCRGQQPIKVDVNLVNVAFTARDSQGKLVESLKREDVELREDAVPQKIEFFARSTDLPLTLAPTRSRGSNRSGVSPVTDFHPSVQVPELKH